MSTKESQQAGRVFNFNAGPAALPIEALEQAQREMLDFEGTGMSIVEHSHRGAAYDKVHEEALALLRELLAVPESHEILFMQGGGRMQFGLVPMNLLREGEGADYLVTGSWAKLALEDARYYGPARAAADTEEEDGSFRRVPRQEELDLDPRARYLHLTANNTLFGTQFHRFPDTGGVPLIADMTSDLLSRPIDVGRFGLIYAGAQKNLGPAGVTVVIADKALIETGRKDIPEIFRYSTFAKKRSLYNTPPTFAIYLMRNVLRVIRDQGGAAAMAERAEKKASLVYGALLAHPEVYRLPVEEASRSLMNAVFHLHDEERTSDFLKMAKAEGLAGLKGHRSVGGLRASLYNAVPVEAAEALVDLLHRFARA